MAMDDWPQAVIRCDAPTVSGEHEGTAGGWLPCCQSQDEPTRPPITVLLGALEPLGLPLSTDVLSGERADDGVSLPRIERRRIGLHKTGRVFVGAGTMSAVATRASLARHQDMSWSPLPWTGATAAAMAAWSTAGVAPGEAGARARLGRPHDRGHAVRAAEGDACARPGGAPGGTEGGAARFLG